MWLESMQYVLSIICNFKYFEVWFQNAYTRLQPLLEGFGGIEAFSSPLTKSTSLHRNTTYDVLIIKITLPVRALRDSKNEVKKKGILRNQQMTSQVFAKTTHVVAVSRRLAWVVTSVM